MDCLYLEAGMCRAKPPAVGYYYKPDDETTKSYCKNLQQMRTCPRIATYNEFLTAFHNR